MVELNLSKASVLNTVVSTPDGNPLYTITTPYKWTHRTSTISRHAGGAQPTEVARIQWRQMHSPTLEYNGQTVKQKTFMPAKTAMRTTRVFTGPDGTAYQWVQGLKTACWLETDIESKSPRVVAKLQDHNLNFGGPKATLEIDPSVEHMLELIIITCCFAMGMQEINLTSGVTEVTTAVPGVAQVTY